MKQLKVILTTLLISSLTLSLSDAVELRQASDIVSHNEGRSVAKAKAKAKDVPDESVIDEVMEELHPTVALPAQKPAVVGEALITRDATEIVQSLTQDEVQTMLAAQAQERERQVMAQLEAAKRAKEEAALQK